MVYARRAAKAFISRVKSDKYSEQEARRMVSVLPDGSLIFIMREILRAGRKCGSSAGPAMVGRISKTDRKKREEFINQYMHYLRGSELVDGKQEAQRSTKPSVEKPEVQDRAGLQKFYFIFDDDPDLPYQNTYLVAHAKSLFGSIVKFQRKYPNSYPDRIDCTDVYSEKEWQNMLLQDRYPDGPREVIE